MIDFVAPGPLSRCPGYREPVTSETSLDETTLCPPPPDPRRRRRTYGAFLLVGLAALALSIARQPVDWFDATFRFTSVAVAIAITSLSSSESAVCLHVSSAGLSWGERGDGVTWALVHGVEVRRRPLVLRLIGVSSTVRLTDRVQVDFARRAGTRADAPVIMPRLYGKTVDQVLDVLERHANERVRAQLIAARRSST